jgi:hypothetical protein
MAFDESTEKANRSCKERIQEQYDREIKAVRTLWNLYQRGEDEGDPDLGTFPEHGLSFDYVAAGTFSDQKEGFFRWQISTGGPGDEFRFYTDAQVKVYCIEYVFLDWWDGATLELSGQDYDLLAEIFEFFRDCGAVESELRKAEE